MTVKCFPNHEYRHITNYFGDIKFRVSIWNFLRNSASHVWLNLQLPMYSLYFGWLASSRAWALRFLWENISSFVKLCLREASSKSSTEKLFLAISLVKNVPFSFNNLSISSEFIFRRKRVSHELLNLWLDKNPWYQGSDLDHVLQGTLKHAKHVDEVQIN